MTWQILQGDAPHLPLADESVQVVCTSPPYWGIRDYRVDKQIGLELSPQDYVEQMLLVFAEVWRVLKSDGTLWVNLGDSYNAYNGGAGPSSNFSKGAQTTERPRLASGYGLRFKGLKPKDLLGIPWRVAFALQEMGFYLRSDIIWHKPNPMPESVKDRPTKAHEYLFLLTKNERYYYNAEAVKELTSGTAHSRGNGINPKAIENGQGIKQNQSFSAAVINVVELRNMRSVWTIPTQATPFAHFATFPTALAERCIRAGSKPGDIVFDPFSGSGTTVLVADRLGRHGIGLDLNSDYCRIATARLRNETPLFDSAADAPHTQGGLWA